MYEEWMQDYTRLRAKGIPLRTELVKSMGRDTIERAAQALGMLQGRQIVLETEDEIAVLMDYALQQLYGNGENTVQRYLRTNPPPEGSDELRILRAEAQAEYGMFEVVRAMPRYGVELKEVFQQETRLLLDRGFSQTATPGVLLASHIVSMGPWWMTTGAGLPVTPEAAPGIAEILIEMRAAGPVKGGGMWDPARVANVIRTCVAAGASHSVRYEDPSRSSPSWPSSLTRHHRPKRNDPCPCGSGKKYKKCCGA